jgi:hypothetical protein
MVIARTDTTSAQNSFVFGSCIFAYISFIVS